MQKYLWGGAALIVAALAASYVGVDYAARHPESFLARCCTAVSSVSMRCNPLSTFNTAVTGKAASGQQTQTVVAEGCVPKPERSTGGTDEQTIEPIQVEPTPQGTEPPQVGWHRIDAADDSEPLVDFSKVMVPCEDPIQPMPYTETDPSEDVVVKPEGDVEDNSAGYYNRCGHAGRPGCEVWAKKKKKLLGLGSMEQGELCEVFGCEVLRSTEQLPNMPEEEQEALPTEEETLPMIESNYQPESNNQPYHHQGCPYMGGCPYCPPSYYKTPDLAVPLPTIQEENSSAVDSDTSSPRRLRSSVKMQQTSLWEKFFLNFSAESRPFNDTMEYRPTDAGSTVTPVRTNFFPF